jgi:hypothetical protein
LPFLWNFFRFGFLCHWAPPPLSPLPPVLSRITLGFSRMWMRDSSTETERQRPKIRDLM